jgi:hypothetical protein
MRRGQTIRAETPLDRQGTGIFEQAEHEHKQRDRREYPADIAPYDGRFFFLGRGILPSNSPPTWRFGSCS